MQIINNNIARIQNNESFSFTKPFNTESGKAIDTEGILDEGSRDFWTEKEIPYTPIVSDAKPAVQQLFLLANYTSPEETKALEKVIEVVKSNTPALFIGKVISDTVSGPVGTALVHEMARITMQYLVDIDLSRVKDPQLVEEYMRDGHEDGNFILLENPDKASPEMLQRITDVTMQLPESKFSRIFAASTGDQHIDIDGFIIVDVTRKTINNDLKQEHKD
ncbi:MAG: hypothetical protein AB2L14_00725 [Candidatus Xenobiia bacterium LiM19]